MYDATVLLIATKFLLPRTSFIGHLSGIIIGYPLAWKALNWLTPPVSYSIFAMWVISRDWLFVWTFKGYDKEPPAWKVFQHTLSRHPINTTYQRTLSIHPINITSLHTLSTTGLEGTPTHPVNTPYHTYQHILS